MDICYGCKKRRHQNDMCGCGRCRDCCKFLKEA